MRPLFAIAPLALAFALLGPLPADASMVPEAKALVVWIWHAVLGDGAAHNGNGFSRLH